MRRLSRSIWWHYFFIIVPDDLDPATANKATIYNTGGNNHQGCPHLLSEDMIIGSLIAVSTKTITAVLYQIPNQPVVFYDEQPPVERSEDSAIAYTWRHYLNDQSNPFWLMRLPMVKAVVRSMDTITSYTNGQVTEFIIAGASKRGWVTWLTGVVDTRIIGIIPLVLDELNFVKNMHHHFRAYGGWTWILKDYWNLNVTTDLDSPQMAAMMDIVDPISYPTQLARIPKLIVSSAGDEFLVTDNVVYFWDMLGGEKHFHSMANCEHTLVENLPGVLQTVIGFATYVLHGVPRPAYKWNINSDGSITFIADPSTPPSKVVLWKAYTIDGNYRRDFRLVSCANNCTDPKHKAGLHPVFWSQSPLYPAPGTQSYQAYVEPPASGWVGFIVEAFFPGPNNATFSVSSAPSILPNTFPFPDCHGQDCHGRLV